MMAVILHGAVIDQIKLEHVMKRKLPVQIVVPFASIALSGLAVCVWTDFIGGSPTTDRERRATNESRGVGSAVGALLGTGAAIAIGGPQGKRGADLYGPAAMGGGGGGIIGHEVGVRKGVQAVTEGREARSDRDELQVMVSAAYDYSLHSAGYNQELSSRVDSIRQGSSLFDPQAELSDAGRQQETITVEFQRRSQLANTEPCPKSFRGEI